MITSFIKHKDSIVYDSFMVYVGKDFGSNRKPNEQPKSKLSLELNKHASSNVTAIFSKLRLFKSVGATEACPCPVLRCTDLGDRAKLKSFSSCLLHLRSMKPERVSYRRFGAEVKITSGVTIDAILLSERWRRQSIHLG